MSVSYFVIYEGKPADPEEFARYYIDRHGPLVEAFPGLMSLVIQTRIPSDDPMLPEEDGPFLVTHMRFEDKAALENALGKGWIAPDATIVWEESSAMLAPGGFSVTDHRNWGSTHVTLLEVSG